MPSTLLFGELTRDSLRALSTEAIALVPLGATEQHGRQLPAATDTMIASHLAESAVRLVGDDAKVVLCPAMPYGFSEHHVPFGATISLDSDTYIRALASIGRSLSKSGFKRLIFLNGHGGNAAPGATAADRLVTELGLNLAVGVLNYWDCIDESVLASLPMPAPGHAGQFEASLLSALRPELVRALPEDRGAEIDDASRPLNVSDRMTGTTRFPQMWQASDGVTDTVSRPDPQLGSELLETASVAIAEYIKSFDAATR
ncbi:creatininase family protein [Ruania alba]|uniref:Creatinine amidohydrolase n=1 Tax=Ruania alba TaxID=648782 RepID=A0A1H5KLE8_9MICO|nr:creatininase family protein [Ruania alba]SEE65669.1 creatinine amidohydrolase [Ruania alba]